MSVPRTAQAALARTIEISKVPGPTFDEGERADLVSGWLRSEGLEPSIDAAGNVRARLRSGTGPALVVCAHMDTVFDRQTSHRVQVVDDRLLGPAVGDNNVALAALSLLSRVVPGEGATPVWVVGTTGEEGLGNLSGARHLLGDDGFPISHLIAVEGNYLGRVVHVGVGSIRYQVDIEGPGGHAWEASGNPSAVHEMGRLIARLGDLDFTDWPRSSLNVGVANGGEAINARARYARMMIDLRSEDRTALTRLAQRAREILDASRLETTIRQVGDRPAGSIDPGHELVRAGVAGLAAVGRVATHPASSTDANAAYERGVPAITLGITTGSGEHTPGEWIDIGPIGDGIRALAATIGAMDREVEA